MVNVMESEAGLAAFEDQAGLFKVLTHPARLAILEILRGGEQCVCHMEAVLGLRQAYISQQLMVLRQAGLVTDRRDGWNIFYQVIRPEVYEVLDAAAKTTADPAHVRLTFALHARPHACPCPKCQDAAAAR